MDKTTEDIAKGILEKAGLDYTQCEDSAQLLKDISQALKQAEKRGEDRVVELTTGFIEQGVCAGMEKTHPETAKVIKRQFDFLINSLKEQ